MILGVDIGTSVTKAGLVSRDGRVTHVSSIESSLNRGPNGIVEQDLEQILDTVSQVVRAVAEAAKIAGATIEAVALTAQGDGLWLRDKAGYSTRPVISWSDGRASKRIADWSLGGADSILQKVYELTGSAVFPGSHAALIAELAETEPDSLRQAHVAGYCADAVLFRLTGVLSVDPSDASMPFLDVQNGQYVDAALEACGILEWKHLLAEPAAPGAVFALDEEGAEILGLPVGTSITAGPYDLQACAFGGASVQDGDGAIIFGTTLATLVFTKDAQVVPGTEPAGMWLRTPVEGLFQRVMPSMVGAASIAWLQRVLKVDHDELSGLLGKSVPGANGVRALSFFSLAGERAPFVNPDARGQFVGLSLDTERADLARALFEAIAFAARNCFDTLGGTGELIATGGAFGAAGAAQVFADVLGRPIYIPDEDLLGVRGAAMVAWASLGKPIELGPLRDRRTKVTPNPEQTIFYDAAYAMYLRDLATAETLWGEPKTQTAPGN